MNTKPIKCNICNLTSHYHEAVFHNINFYYSPISKTYKYLLMLVEGHSRHIDSKDVLLETNTIIKYHYPKLMKLMVLL
jgi:hypothetical protein